MTTTAIAAPTVKARSKAKSAGSVASVKTSAKGVAARSVDARLVRLSDPEMQPAMDRLKARIASDPEFAKSLLRSAGIVNAKGKLTKRFGG